MYCTIFICQRCLQPLKRCEPQETLTSEPEEPGESGVTLQEQLEELSEGGLSDTVLIDGRKSRNKDCYCLSGSVSSARTLNSIQETVLQIFETISGQREIDHPLCVECTDNLLEQLDSQITLSELDIQSYERCVESGEMQVEDEMEVLKEELRVLEQEEALLDRELEKVEEGCMEAAAALQEAQAETKKLERQESQYHVEYSALTWQQLELCEQLRSMENQLWYAQQQLSWLNSASIFQFTFEIWQEGPVGVINNLRLGCPPSGPVDWDEINAAWGQVALLLVALSNTIGLQFQRYQPVPRADHSYLKALTGNSALLPLFSDGSQNVFLNNEYDRAMIAFLDCLQQFKEKAEQGHQGLQLPYRIWVESGVLEDVTGSGDSCELRTHLNTRERWTQALSFMLVNLKCSLAWASLRYGKN
ncbi:beclin-2 [Ochotona princeps]|uniref:beclin-2 n=1 Tax=Ochotona princeps TaxID=9978 RepID=UPI002714C8AF|nr:beclin-2 [Ochotona princeps]